MTANFYDVCRRLTESAMNPNLFVKAKPIKGAKDSFSFGIEMFRMDDVIGSGSYGEIWTGIFKTTSPDDRPKTIALKVNDSGTLEDDLEEMRAHAEAFCAQRARAFEFREAAGIGKIPKPLFAAMIPMGRVLGMERLDAALCDYLLDARWGNEARALDHACKILRSLFGLIAFLQKDWIQFMHGDLHGFNVMVRHSPDPTAPPAAYLIDFGMSSYVPYMQTRRRYVDHKYARTRFNPHTDPLMLLTHLSEWAMRQQWPRLALITLRPIEPFWTRTIAAVRQAAKAPANDVVRFIRQRGDSIPWSHHALYEHMHQETAPSVEPLALVDYFDSDPEAQEKTAPADERKRVRALLKRTILQ